MADEIRFSINVIPIEEVTQSVTYTGEEEAGVLVDVVDDSYEVIATEIQKTLGGSGSAKVSSYDHGSSSGYTNGTAYYGSAGSTAIDLGIETTASFIFVKNTGKKYIDINTLGDTSTNDVEVYSGTTLISVLSSGECIIFKDNNAGLDSTGFKIKSSGSDTVAVEYLIVD